MRITEGTIDKDFFDQNPHWRYLNSSEKLARVFDDTTASKLRWAVYLIMDPESPYFRYPLDRRYGIVNKYLGDVYTLTFNNEDRLPAEEDIKFLFESYVEETMDETKRRYYEQEESFQRLMELEKESDNLKLKADVQLKMTKVSDYLTKLKSDFEKELVEEERKRSRGTQQPGLLFN